MLDRNRRLLIVIACASLLDYVTTLFGVSRGLEETNVVILWGAEYVGFVASLTGIKLLSLSLLVALTALVDKIAPHTYSEAWTRRGTTVVLSVCAAGYMLVSVTNFVQAV